MSCVRARHLDLAGFSAEPAASEWSEFRAHYPTCADCSEAVAQWARLRAALQQVGGDDPTAHPEDAELLAFADRPQGLSEVRRNFIESHLATCKPCKSELAVLRRFDLAALAIAPVPERTEIATGPTLAERLRGLLEEFFVRPFQQPAFAMAMLALLAVPVGIAIWRMLPVDESGATPQLAREEPAPIPEEAEPPDPAAPGSTGESQLARDGEPQPSGALTPPEAPPNEPRPEQLAARPAAEPTHAVSREEPAPAPRVARQDDLPPAPIATHELEPVPIDELLDPRDPSAQLPEAAPIYRPQLALAGGSFESVRSTSVIRGASDDLPTATLLAPAHVAATSRDAPVLYWHLSGTSEVPVRLTLIAEDGIEPLLELRLEPPVASGPHALSLSERGIRLESGLDYDWFVSLIPDPASPDKEILSHAVVRLTPPDAQLEARLRESGPARRAEILAGAGYWLDAFDVLSELAAAAPDVKRAAEHRAALLDQVGLGALAPLPAP